MISGQIFKNRLIYFFLLVGAYYLVVPFINLSSKAVTDIFFLLLLLLTFYDLSFLGQKIPKIVLFSSLILVCGFSYLTNQDKQVANIVIKQLEGDSSGQLTSQLAEMLRKKTDLKVRWQEESPENILSDNISFIFGSQRWLNLSNHRPEFYLLADTVLGKDLDLNLMIASDLPLIGLPLNPVDKTVGFIADLHQLNQQPNAEDQKIGWQLLGSSLFHWNESSHLAYAYFRLADIQLKNILNKNTLIDSEVACLLKSLKKAKNLVRGRQNPELLAAIYNNLAVISYIQKYYQKVKAKKLVKKMLKKAKQATKLPNPYSYPSRLKVAIKFNQRSLKADKQLDKRLKQLNN